MNIAKLGAVILTGALLTFAVDAPASAASLATNVFLNNLVPNVDFLAHSSQFAPANSKNAKVKAFARATAQEQGAALKAVNGWISADPVVVAAKANGTFTDGVQTGRSVAVDGQTETDMRLALGHEDLDSLEGLTGRDFDDQYLLKQQDALTQVETDYQTYLAKGDDPVLLALAKRELPKVERRLELLKRM